jgi:hypothetical protein
MNARAAKQASRMVFGTGVSREKSVKVPAFGPPWEPDHCTGSASTAQILPAAKINARMR